MDDQIRLAGVVPGSCTPQYPKDQGVFGAAVEVVVSGLVKQKHYF